MTNADHSDFDTPTDMTTNEISARDRKLNDDYTIKINIPPSACVINHADDTALSDDNDNQMMNQGQNPPTRRNYQQGEIFSASNRTMRMMPSMMSLRSQQWRKF
jgi:hypothetical protein